jgi:hypothetical protein
LAGNDDGPAFKSNKAIFEEEGSRRGEITYNKWQEIPADASCFYNSCGELFNVVGLLAKGATITLYEMQIASP